MDDTLDLFDVNTEKKLEKEIEQLDKVNILKVEIDQSLEDAINEINSLKQEYSSDQAENLIDLCKENVMNTIVGQFGLASLFIESQDGGNVTTIHNAQKKIYADKKDEYNREIYEKGHYTPGKNGEKGSWSGNSEGKRFSGDSRNSVGAEFTRSQMDENGYLTDAYTNKRVKADTTSPDHIYSLSEFHKNGGYMLSDKEKCDFATDVNNLASTDRSINNSLRDRDKMEWSDSKDNGRDITNQEYFGTDREAMKRNVERGDKTAQKHLPTNKEKVLYYSKNVALSGVKDAGKIAAYSVIGVIIHDFALAVVEELKYILKNKGQQTFKELFNHFKEKMTAVMSELKKKWKDILENSFEAGLKAFLSNILVFVINLFATTLKKLVSMIRAGFVSLCQAVKIMSTRPDGISQDEANYQAAKVLTAGLIGALSLGLSAAIEEFLQSIPGLQPVMMFPIPSFGREQRTVSDVVAVTLSAVAGGLVSTIVLYFMDKCRNNAKKDKMQIQMITTSGVIVQCKVAESWFSLNNAYDFFAEMARDDIENIKETYNKITTSKEENDKNISELDDIIEQI